MTELKLLNKTIADVPLDTQQKLCAAMGEQLGPMAILLPCAAGCVTQGVKPEDIAKLNGKLKEVIPGLDDITKDLTKMVASAKK